MLSDQSPGVAAIGAGLGTKTGSKGGILDGQITLFNCFVPVNVCYRNFSCGNEIEIPAFYLEQILFKFR